MKRSMADKSCENKAENGRKNANNCVKSVALPLILDHMLAK
jgi:hypothetical protein